jgi:hypothetical protein
MAKRITFENVNVSVQVGDHLYLRPELAPTTVRVGLITEVGNNYIITDESITPIDLVIDANAFFFFRKPDNKNISSLKGYYAKALMVNSQTKKQELFAVGSEISVSSK